MFRYFLKYSVTPLFELSISVPWEYVPLRLVLGCHSLRYLDSLRHISGILSFLSRVYPRLW